MADDLTVYNGPSTAYNVATDDVGSDKHAQIVKLAYSANGSRTHATVDAFGVLVNTGTVATATLTNVNDTATSTPLLAANTNRRGVTIFNDSLQALLVKYGATASTTSFTVRVAAGGYWEMPQPVYTGALDGVWTADSTGAARITELT